MRNFRKSFGQKNITVRKIIMIIFPYTFWRCNENYDIFRDFVAFKENHEKIWFWTCAKAYKLTVLPIFYQRQHSKLISLFCKSISSCVSCLPVYTMFTGSNNQFWNYGSWIFTNFSTSSLLTLFWQKNNNKWTKKRLSILIDFSVS